MLADVEQLVWHPKLRSLHDYWRSKRASAELPRKRNIDPAEIGSLLNNVFLVSVERDPIRFRYRLLGSAIIGVSRANMTGRTMDEAYPGIREKATYLDYLACTEQASVCYYRGHAMFDPDFAFLTTDRILLPMTDGSGAVDFILGGAIHRNGSGVEI